MSTVRVAFDDIFREKEDKLVVRQPIRCGGITCHKGFELSRGMRLGPIAFTDWVGRDLEVHDEYPYTKNWVRVIVGIYGENKSANKKGNHSRV